jgi:NAD(P)-dependent dehydrogenase (short-subunit alcohol dehydrogenase family)
MGIDGKVALVTGTGQGIGRALALRLANDGTDIAIGAVKDEKMKAVADEVRAVGRKATTFRADVSKRDDVFAAVDHAERALGGFDIIVNNAGIAPIQPLADVTPVEVGKILKVNPEVVPWGIQAAAWSASTCGSRSTGGWPRSLGPNSARTTRSSSAASSTDERGGAPRTPAPTPKSLARLRPWRRTDCGGARGVGRGGRAAGPVGQQCEVSSSLRPRGPRVDSPKRDYHVG